MSRNAEKRRLASAAHEFKDGLTGSVNVELTWRERLRVLFGKPVLVSFIFQTQNIIGRYKIDTCAEVAPVFEANLDSEGQEVNL